MRAYLFVLVAGRQRNFNAFLLEWDQNPMDLQVSFDWIRLPIAVCELSNVAITVTILMKAIWSAAEPLKIDHQVEARAGRPLVARPDLYQPCAGSRRLVCVARNSIGT